MGVVRRVVREGGRGGGSVKWSDELVQKVVRGLGVSVL